MLQPPPIDFELALTHGLDAFGIGVVGAGFIVRDCHLVAYQQAGFRTVAITSRTASRAEEVARLRGVPKVYRNHKELAADPDVSVIDIAVPPQFQLQIVRDVLEHGKSVRGILAQKPLAMSPADAREIVLRCEDAGVMLAVNQNMRHDQSVRACKDILNRGWLGEVVLASIDMRAIPHWMPWSEGLRSLSTYIMSIHHLDCLRYWLGDPVRIFASTRPDPRTKFEHADGVNLYILEYESGARAFGCDDVWTGPVREGSAGKIGVSWRVEGTAGLACGEIGWPRYPTHTPSTLEFTCQRFGDRWHSPRWNTAWFPEAFRGTMGELLTGLQSHCEPSLNGRDNLRTIALVEAVLQSAREHRVVEWDDALSGIAMK
jgi:predicted dehydrogenase